MLIFCNKDLVQTRQYVRFLLTHKHARNPGLARHSTQRVHEFSQTIKQCKHKFNFDNICPRQNTDKTVNSLTPRCYLLTICLSRQMDTTSPNNYTCNVFDETQSLQTGNWPIIMWEWRCWELEPIITSVSLVSISNGMKGGEIRLRLELGSRSWRTPCIRYAWARGPTSTEHVQVSVRSEPLVIFRSDRSSHQYVSATPAHGREVCHFSHPKAYFSCSHFIGQVKIAY